MPADLSQNHNTLDPKIGNLYKLNTENALTDTTQTVLVNPKLKKKKNQTQRNHRAIESICIVNNSRAKDVKFLSPDDEDANANPKLPLLKNSEVELLLSHSLSLSL